MKKRICCFALALGLPLSALGAQETPALAAGARVRVLSPTLHCRSLETPTCHDKVVGTLVSLDSLNIVLRDEGGEVQNLPRVPGTRLDASAGGMCLHRGTCIGLGLVSGAAVGALVGWINYKSIGCPADDDLCSLYQLTVPAGAILGAVIGAVLPGEHWRETTAPAHLSIAPEGAGRFVVGVSVRF